MSFSWNHPVWCIQTVHSQQSVANMASSIHALNHSSFYFAGLTFIIGDIMFLSDLGSCTTIRLKISCRHCFHAQLPLLSQFTEFQGIAALQSRLYYIMLCEGLLSWPVLRFCYAVLDSTFLGNIASNISVSRWTNPKGYGNMWNQTAAINQNSPFS